MTLCHFIIDFTYNIRYCRSVIKNDTVSQMNGGYVLPKETFFNLPVEKQNNLIEAAQKEFSRAPLNEASISNILKHAQIPRGSFYQYFTDKEDAFFYLIELATIKSRDQFLNYLEEVNGDLVATFTKLFKQLLLEFKKEENRSFFRNIFLNMNYKTECFFAKGMELEDSSAQLIKVTDMKALNAKDTEDLIRISKILRTVTIWHLIEHFAKERSYEESLIFFEKDLGLLKQGLYKKSE